MATRSKFGENQVQHDEKLYVTYGSFTVKTTGAKKIITSEQTLRDAGKNTGGIILKPRKPTDLHTKSDKPQPGMSANTCELLIAVATPHKMYAKCGKGALWLYEYYHPTKERYAGLP
jgi:hypothetical protein